MVQLKQLRPAHVPYVLAWAFYYAWALIYATWHSVSPASLLLFTAPTRSVTHLVLLLTCGALVCFVPRRAYRPLARGGSAMLLCLVVLFFLLPNLRGILALLIGAAMGMVCVSLLLPFVYLLNNTEKFYAILGGTLLQALLGLLYQSGWLRGSWEQIFCGIWLLAVVVLLYQFRREDLSNRSHDMPKPTKITYFSFWINLGFAATVLGGGFLLLNVTPTEFPGQRYVMEFLGSLAGCAVYYFVFAKCRKSLQMTWSITFSTFFLAMFLRALWQNNSLALHIFAGLIGFSSAIGFLNMYYTVGVAGKKYGRRSHLLLTMWFGVAGGGLCILVGIFSLQLSRFVKHITIPAMVGSALLMAAYFIFSPILSRTYFAEEWIDDSESCEIPLQPNPKELLSQLPSEPLDVTAMLAAQREALYAEYGLTQREREICELLVTTGYAQKQLADQLSLSADTVKFHIKNIYRKFGVQSRTELAAKCNGSTQSPQTLNYTAAQINAQ